jgi:hypothetical protein
MMPVPDSGETASEFRRRLREFFDRFAVPGQSVESSRESWVDVMARHGIDPGDDYTAADRHVVTSPGLLGVVRIGKPLSTMTPDERATFKAEIAATMRAGYEAAKLADAADMDSDQFVAIQIGCAGGIPWNRRDTRKVPDTAACRTLWSALFVQCAEMRANGIHIDIVE